MAHSIRELELLRDGAIDDWHATGDDEFARLARQYEDEIERRENAITTAE